MSGLTYRLNTNDEIIFVDPRWYVFARENGFRPALGQPIIGTSLWRHISDPSVRHLYKIFADRVRLSKQTIVLPFRCDAPNKRRYMEMHIAYIKKDVLEFKTVLLHEKWRKPVKMLAAEKSPLSRVLLMCIWCKQIKASKWLEPELALRELNLFKGSPLPIISHVVCPTCESHSLKAVLL